MYTYMWLVLRIKPMALYLTSTLPLVPIPATPNFTVKRNKGESGNPLTQEGICDSWLRSIFLYHVTE